MFERPFWIWAEDNRRKNDRVYFRKRFRVEKVPARALLRVGCETKYWLFVNGRLAVFDGGLFRESLPGCGYYDETDISPYLREGENEMVFHVWFFGNGGRNNTAIGRAGRRPFCSVILRALLRIFPCGKRTSRPFAASNVVSAGMAKTFPW